MSEKECKERILALIEEIYNKRYTGALAVKKKKPIGWEIYLGMNNSDKPILIAAELPDDKFLEFFRQELLNRNWNSVHYFMGEQIIKQPNE